MTSEEKPQPPTESAEDESADAEQGVEEKPEELVEQARRKMSMLRKEGDRASSSS